MEPILPTLIVSGFIAAASSLLGSFALLRRMALVGDALAHVALPGIALGIIFNFDLLAGALIFLILGVIMIWLVEHKTNLPVDTLVGIFFSLALAVGAVILPGEEIEEALFGDIMTLRNFDLFLAIVISLLSIIALIAFRRKLTLIMISRDLAFSAGFRPSYFELMFLIIFALVVAAGIKFAGALLMGPLVIIPAAIARNLASSMVSYMWLAVSIGVISSWVTVYISFLYHLPTGPVFVFLASLVFFLSTLLAKK